MAYSVSLKAPTRNSARKHSAVVYFSIMIPSRALPAKSAKNSTPLQIPLMQSAAIFPIFIFSVPHAMHAKNTSMLTAMINRNICTIITSKLNLSIVSYSSKKIWYRELCCQTKMTYDIILSEYLVYILSF